MNYNYNYEFDRHYGGLTNFLVNVCGYKPVKLGGKENRLVCPHHSPSKNNSEGRHLRINDSKQLFFCNVCENVGNTHTGSYVEAVMLNMNMDQKSAFKWLCNECGITKDSNGEYTPKEIRQAFIEVCHQNLMKNKPKEAIQYVLNRGFNQRILNSFRIGFSDSSEFSILKERGFQQSDFIKAGILLETKDKKKHYNAFKNRIVLMAGDNIYGRSIIQDNKLPHIYTSSPNKIFNEQNSLNKDVVFIVEATFDAASIKSYIIELGENWGCIATLGTKGVDDKNLKEFILSSSETTEFVIIPDNDKWFSGKSRHAAGQVAGLKKAKLIQSLGRKARLLVLPEDSDPNDLLKNKVDAIAFRKMVEEALTPFEYALYYESHFHNVTCSSGKPSFLNRCKKIFQTYDMEIKSEAIKAIAKIVNLKESEVNDYFLNDVKKQMAIQYIIKQKQHGLSNEDLIKHLFDLAKIK